MYDFDALIPRKDVGSEKWNAMYALDPAVGDEIVPLSVADMEFPSPPEVAEEICRCAREFPIYGYTAPTQAYFDAVTGWMGRRHGWSVRADWVVPTPGVVTAFFSAVTAFTQPGEGVIVMPPVYYPFFLAADRTGRQLVRNSLVRRGNRYEIDFDDLERKAADPANRLLLLCSPHNPVGRVWTRDELLRLADICLRNNVLIVSDEIHFDMVMPGFRHTVLATLSEEVAQNCIICTAPSKTFNLAGLLTSNIVIQNDRLRRRFRDERRKIASDNLNIFGIAACQAAYDRCEGWLTEALTKIDENRRLCEDFLARRIPVIQALPMEGTYLQWWDCRALGMDAKALETFMTQKARLFLDEGYIFGDEGAGYERINLACPTPVLVHALERLAAAVHSG